MRNSLTLLCSAFVGMMLQTAGVTTNTSHQAYHEVNQIKYRPGKRNTKFIIPALISHMYHQKLDDSPLSTMLNKPFTRRVGKTDNEKREDHNLEHRTIEGNAKKDEHGHGLSNSKSPVVTTKEIPVLLEVRGKEGKCSDSGAAGERGGSVIQVGKHFRPLSRNWFAGPPSVVWPPYSLEQFQNARFPRPLFPGSSALEQNGFVQNVIEPAGSSFLVDNEHHNDIDHNNVIAQERKFMVTNITKYVLDFYCPHCGGEISVSKNKNKGGLFGAEHGSISINKGKGDPTEAPTSSTQTIPTAFPTGSTKQHR